MLNGTFYLNNNGSRWVGYINGVKDKITLKTESGKEITRTVVYYSMLGNFGVVTINYKGKRLSIFPDSILID